MTSTALMNPVDTLSRMRTTERTDFGERLHQARLYAKLSQEELAARVEMRQTNLSHLERRGTGSLKVAELARACGVRMHWLATGEGPMTGPEGPEDIAATLASEALPRYLPPSGARDYRTVVRTLADALEESGITLTVRQFVDLAERTFAKISRE